MRRSRTIRRYRGNYFYRDGQKLPLVKVPDAFALRLRAGRLPAELRAWARGGERIPPVAMERAYGRQRLATYRVRGAAAARDRAMDALRRDGHAPGGGAEDGSEKAADTGRLLMQ